MPRHRQCIGVVVDVGDRHRETAHPRLGIERRPIVVTDVERTGQLEVPDDATRYRGMRSVDAAVNDGHTDAASINRPPLVIAKRGDDVTTPSRDMRRIRQPLYGVIRFEICHAGIQTQPIYLDSATICGYRRYTLETRPDAKPSVKVAASAAANLRACDQ